MAPTSTRSPGRKSFTSLPTECTVPTASWPSVRFSLGPMPPCTVWESDVQIRALVVLTTAAPGPGSGTGLSMKPTRPISFITNAFMRLPFLPAHRCARQRVPAESAAAPGVSRSLLPLSQGRGPLATRPAILLNPARTPAPPDPAGADDPVSVGLRVRKGGGRCG